MSDPLLEVDRLDAFYGDFQALYGISMRVEPGQIVSLIGSNGAGKSTTLRTIVGLMKARGGEVRFQGKALGAMPAYEVVKEGIALVPEGRRLFPSLTVEENILLGGQVGRKGDWNLKRVYQLFPMLEERRNNPATSLSGGQQQMAAIGRALMSNPSLLLCDEISLGLAPIIVREIYAQMPSIVAGGLSAIVVEQDIGQALKISNRVYCLQEGRVALDRESGSVTREEIAAAYFGV